MCSSDLIDVVPTTALAHEAAGFVQSVRTPAEPAARDELDHGAVVGQHLVPAHIQPQPAQAGLENHGLGRSCAGMPGGLEIVALLQHNAL